MRTKTPEQVKKQFEREGRAIADWARDNGYHCVAVYRVLNGFTKAKRGQAHEIAVKLGLKEDPARAA